jgi:hypothetical protein
VTDQCEDVSVRILEPRGLDAVAPDLEAIVVSCLAKDPEVRPQTADELATRVAGVQLGCEWTMLRAREWWDTHRPSPPPSLLPT